MRDLLTLADLLDGEIERIFSVTEDLKTKYVAGLREALLPGRVLALLFETPALRTRDSFESAMIHLGGSSIYLRAEAGLGRAASLGPNHARLAGWVPLLACPAVLGTRLDKPTVR